jgi:site-specific recombinase XerD
MNTDNTIAYQLERYLRYTQVIRNYADATLLGYRDTFKLFLKETKIIYPKEMTKRVVEDWFFHGRIERKWSACTFHHHHKRLNKFMEWLVNEKIVEENVILLIEKPKLEHRLPKTLSKEQAQRLLDATFHMHYTYRYERYRNRAVIACMLLAGLRKGEVRNLLLNDVSLDQKTIFVRQGKGHKDRMIPVNARLQFILTEYLKERKRLNKQCINFFTGAQFDRSLGAGAIDNLVARLRKLTKISFSAHTLRHGFARLMLEGGCDIYTLSKIMGHSKITTTTIYLMCSNVQMSKAVEMHLLN